MKLQTILKHVKPTDILLYLTVLASVSIFLLYFAHFDSIKIGGEYYLHVADDHMITMRVAQNFADFGVPYFNREEMVAANTSLFWPLILGATVMKFPAHIAVSLNIILSVFMSAATIAIAIFWFREWWLRLSAIILLACSATYINYGASGWEHIPQSFCITYGFFLIYKSSQKTLHIPTIAVFLISLSFIFRPDSAVIIAFLILAWMYVDRNYLRLSTYFISALLLAIPVCYLISMDTFYDSFTPNTAKLKYLGLRQGIELGIMYLINPLASGLAPFFLLTLALIKSKSSFSRFVLYISFSHLVYVLLTGGDVFGYGRFFILLLPVLCFVLLTEIRRLTLDYDVVSVKSSLISLVLLASILGNYSTITRNAIKPITYNAEVQQIRILHHTKDRLHPSDGSIGLHWLGVGFHAPEFHIVDFLGKAEPHIASTQPKVGPIGHNRWDYEYAFQNYNIAIIPHSDVTVSTVSSLGFSLVQKDFMFWEEVALFLMSSGEYTYLPAKTFGNDSFGAFVRNDLVAKFQ